MCYHWTPDKDPELVKVYFKEDDWTDANANSGGGQVSFFVGDLTEVFSTL